MIESVVTGSISALLCVQDLGTSETKTTDERAVGRCAGDLMM